MKCDPSGNLCTGGKGADKVKGNDKLVGLDRNSGAKNRNENIQLGSLRKNPGGRFAANETAGVKGK